MNSKPRSCACRHFVLIAISGLIPFLVATAGPPHATDLSERSTFGNDWRILRDDIFFGGAGALFGLSPANRTILLPAAQDSKTRSENGAIVKAANSSDDFFSFVWFLDSAVASRGAAPAVPNAVTAIKQFDGATTGNADPAVGSAQSWGVHDAWRIDGVPTPSDDVLFDNVWRPILQNVHLGGGNSTRTANSITLNLTTNQTWSLGAGPSAPGATLAIATGNITRNSTTNNSLNTIGAVSGLGIGTGIMTLTTGATGFTITNLDSTGNLQINAIITGGAKTVTTAGPGTTIFSGANSYTGATAVTSGTLLINGDQTAATGAVTVKNIGTVLGGTGTIGGAVTVDTGGTITGATNGTVGVLTLNTNLTFSFTNGTIGNYLVDLSGAASDMLVLGGTLNLAGSLDQLTLSGTPDGTSSYILATYTSVIGEFDLDNVPANYQLIYGGSDLILAPIPEPGTWIGAACAFVAIGFSQRRKFREPRGNT